MLRKGLLILAGIILLGGSWYISRTMAENKKQHGHKMGKKTTAVFTTTVNNSNIPVKITTSGQVHAKEQVDLFAEVQGIMERGSRRFFEGTYFKKGEVIIGINKDEFASSLRAQKSNLFNQIVGMMPDLQMDYPEAAAKWENYISEFDIDAKLPQLPEASTDQEKFYVTGKNIYSTYYNIKNLEVRLSKHWIRAPFNGYVTEALVKEGTLIRPGQKLGEFVAPGIFELKVPVNAAYEDFLKVGKKVKTRNIENSKEWTGTISRINRKMDTNTQSIMVIIELRNQDLWDGMFLEAELDAREIENVFEIKRKMLNEGNKIFVVKDSVLQNIYVEPVYFNEGSVIVRNIPEGSKILTNPVPGAYPGMQVEVLNK